MSSGTCSSETHFFLSKQNSCPSAGHFDESPPDKDLAGKGEFFENLAALLPGKRSSVQNSNKIECSYDWDPDSAPLTSGGGCKLVCVAHKGSHCVFRMPPAAKLGEPVYDALVELHGRGMLTGQAETDAESLLGSLSWLDEL